MPRRYRRVRRRAFGDTPVVAASAASSSTPATTSDVSSMSQEQWQAAMLQNAQNQYNYLQYIWQKATVQRYIATAATVSIPIFATLWKWFLRRRAER